MERDDRKRSRDDEVRGRRWGRVIAETLAKGGEGKGEEEE